MASAQAPVGPLCWQAVAAAAKRQLPSLSVGRTWPLLASTSCSLASPVAGPSSSFASSQRFTRGKSSAARPAFKVGDMYSSDPILGGRAKLLNDWNARHEADAGLFEDEAPDEYAALRVSVDDARRSLRAASTSTAEDSSMPLVEAIRAGRWADAREDFQTLHSAGTTVPFNLVYLRAALESLSSREIGTAEDRLEWFILWLSLLPVEVDRRATQLPMALIRQHDQVVEQLLCYPTHLGLLARALMLFCEKGLGEIYGERLLRHIVAFSPPGTAYTLVESMCASAGWASDSAERCSFFNTAIYRLLKNRSLEDAVSTVLKARETSEPFFKRGYVRPTIDRNVYRYLLNDIKRKHGGSSPLLQQLRVLAHEDYPDEIAIGPTQAGDDDRLLLLLTNGRPGAEHLPRAIFLLSRSTTRKTAVALSNILEALYMTPLPRPRLVALLHRRLTTHFDGSYGLGDNAGQRLWITAEMMRLIRVGRPADALSLFAARCQWIALPTSEVWDAFRSYRPELPPQQATLIAEGRPSLVYDPKRKLIAGAKLTEVAYSAIVKMHGTDVQLLTQDYREFLSFVDPAPQPPSPRGPTVATSAAEQESSLFEDLPEPPTSEAAVPFTPWSAPEVKYDLPESERPSPAVWSTWLIAFARVDTKLATGVLRDMRQRAVSHDCRIYGHLLVSMIQAGELDEARASFADLIRQGGILFEDVRSPVTRDTANRRPTVTAQGSADQFPPVTAWLYVRLIREYALSDSPGVSVELEDEMRAAGFPLSDVEQRVMVEAYDIRHNRRRRAAQLAQRTPPAHKPSPWGTPGGALPPNVVYIPGELTSKEGFSYEQPTPAKFHSNTLHEEAYPLRARKLEMAADDLRDPTKGDPRRMRRPRAQQTPKRVSEAISPSDT